MRYEAAVAQEMAAKILDEGIYVIGFFFPVVPRGQARIVSNYPPLMNNIILIEQ